MKQTFKRALALGIVAIMALALVACSDSQVEEASESKGVENTSFVEGEDKGEVETTNGVKDEEPSESEDLDASESEDVGTNEGKGEDESKDEPSEEPTTSQEPTQTPTTTQTPTSTPTTKPIEHVHSYTSSVTKEATCGEDGIRVYICSCGETYNEAIKATSNHNYTSTIAKEPSCLEEGTKVYTCSTCGAMYNEAIAKTSNHEWATRHIDEVGHYESSGTHRVMYKKCTCGFIANSDQPNANEIWTAHIASCNKNYLYWWEEVPNTPQYIVDIPAYDETYCTICGMTK